MITNWHPISNRFEVIADYRLNFGHCVIEPPFGSLGATYTVYLRLTGKKVNVDLLSSTHLWHIESAQSTFPLVLIELFLASVIPEVLRANIDWKLSFSLWQFQFGPKFQLEGVAPSNHSSGQKTMQCNDDYGRRREPLCPHQLNKRMCIKLL